MSRSSARANCLGNNYSFLYAPTIYVHICHVRHNSFSFLIREIGAHFASCCSTVALNCHNGWTMEKRCAYVIVDTCMAVFARNPLKKRSFVAYGSRLSVTRSRRSPIYGGINGRVSGYVRSLRNVKERYEQTWTLGNYATSTQAHNEISCHREHYEMHFCEKHLTRDPSCDSLAWKEKRNWGRRKKSCLVTFFRTFNGSL